MFAEVRNSYETGPLYEAVPTLDIDDDCLGRITIDTWKTTDPDEKGAVAAAVMISKHGDIIIDWHDNSARFDADVLSAIAEARANLKKTYAESDIPGATLAESIRRTLSVLIDNGIEPSEAPTVLQAIGYTLLDTELFPEEKGDKK